MHIQSLYLNAWDFSTKNALILCLKLAKHSHTFVGKISQTFIHVFILAGFSKILLAQWFLNLHTISPYGKVFFG